jgi:hypothetical protein
VKTTLGISVIVFLSVFVCASAHAEFKNPDGRPNAIAIEPLFGYVTGGPFETDELELGLGITVPFSERVTVRGAGMFGNGEYYKTETLLAESDGRTWVINDLKRCEYEQVSFRLSVKIWLGGGKD